MKLKLVTTLFFCASAISATTLTRVACGSTTVVTDPLGNVWNADSNFLGGSSFSQVSAPAEPYRHLRFATSFSYTFQLQAATQYSVTLKFLEPNKTAAGQRTFSVSANATPVLISLDLFLLSNGANNSYDRSFPITVGADGRLVLQFNASLGNAVISAIQIDDIPTPLPPTNGIKCTFGTVIAAQLDPTKKSQEITIAATVPGEFRPEHAILSEIIRFDGNPPLYVSMGRPGTNDTEMVQRLTLGQDGAAPWYFRPVAPQLSGQYDLVLNFSTDADTMNSLVGSLYWEICGYSVSPTSPTLAGLSRCAGPTSPTSNCDGLWKADIVLPDKATFSIIGPVMNASSPNWVPARQTLTVFTK